MEKIMGKFERAIRSTPAETPEEQRKLAHMVTLFDGDPAVLEERLAGLQRLIQRGTEVLHDLREKMKVMPDLMKLMSQVWLDEGEAMLTRLLQEWLVLDTVRAERAGEITPEAEAEILRHIATLERRRTEEQKRECACPVCAPDKH